MHVLGITTAVSGKDIVVVDYRVNPEVDFTGFAIEFIRESKMLDILSQAALAFNSMPMIPSWVPDWSSRYDLHHEKNRLHHHRLYRATRQEQMSRLRFRECAGAMLMTVAGQALSEVSGVGAYMRGERYEGDVQLHILDEWQAIFETRYGAGAHPDQSETQDSSIAFARTMMRDVM